MGEEELGEEEEVSLIVDPLGRRADGEALTIRDLRAWLESVEAIDSENGNIDGDTVLGVTVKAGSNLVANGFVSIVAIRTVVGVAGDGKPVLK